jgi:pyridoxine 5-phosphate synthase
VSTVHSSRTALSVNVNKVALLRNTRHLGTPSVVRAATLCLQAGANGITVHPRPDERHIRANDVQELAQLLQTYPHAEYNIEGNPFHNLMDFVEAIRPAQCTLVPDSSDQFTSDQGWQFPQDAARLKPIVEQLNAWGVRVSLFMDPTPEAMTEVAALGAQRVDGTAMQSVVTEQFVQTAKAALRAGMQVNAGHDLNLLNLAHFLQQLPQVVEVSIGHALIGDALEMGYHATVKAYLASIEQAKPGRVQ